MKVLFVNPLDQTGYGKSGAEYALALDSVGIDIVARRLVFNNFVGPWPTRLVELMNKDATNADVLIQNSLPSHFVRPANFRKVIGMFSWETSDIPPNWVDHLNLMDAVIVPCSQNYQACYKSGVTTPVYVIPFATDVSKYDRVYNPPSFSLNKRGNFVFYTIGENTPRKNFAAIVTAFTLEFHDDEPVQLIVLSAGANKSQMEMEFNEIKKGLKLYVGDQPKKEVILTDFLPEEYVYALHQQCDCYVSASRGESFGIPCFEAKAFRNKVVASDTSGHREYLGLYEKVPCVSGPCIGMANTFPNLYTGRENWDEISIPTLRQMMRIAYEDDYSTFMDEDHRKGWINNYSYKTIGESLKKVLEIVDGR